MLQKEKIGECELCMGQEDENLKKRQGKNFSC